MAVKPIPEGFHTVTPYLIANDAAGLIDFLKQAFNAEEISRHAEEGKIMHATIRIGDSMVMISDASEIYKATQCMIHLYVKNTDAAYRNAIKAGAVSLREPGDEFYGDRSAGVQDSTGNQWWIGTHIEDVSPEEMKKRMDAFRKKK